MTNTAEHYFRQFLSTVDEIEQATQSDIEILKFAFCAGFGSGAAFTAHNSSELSKIVSQHCEDFLGK